MHPSQTVITKELSFLHVPKKIYHFSPCLHHTNFYSGKKLTFFFIFENFKDKYGKIHPTFLYPTFSCYKINEHFLRRRKIGKLIHTCFQIFLDIAKYL